MEPKESVIARRAKPDVAISKGFHLNFVGFSPCSEGIATPVCALARNDTVSKLLDKLKFAFNNEKPGAFVRTHPVKVI